LIANVVDTEEAMMKFSLEEEKAAAIFSTLLQRSHHLRTGTSKKR